MRPNQFTLTPQSDPDGICTSQTPASGGVQSLTIDGALASGGSVTLNHGHLVTITSDGNDSGRTFTVTGTDFRGETLTEAITGPNIATVVGVTYFKTVTGITVDADTAGAITVGPNGQSSSNVIPLDQYQTPFEVGIAVDISGTATYTSQQTYEDVQVRTDLNSLKWFNNADIAGETTDQQAVLNIPVEAVRLIITSYTSGTVKGAYIQAGGF